MQCEQASELISLKQDVELTVEQEHTLQQHLAVCPTCRRLLTQMEYASTLMGSSRILAPRADFTQRVMQQVKRRNHRRAVLGSLGVFVLASVLVGLLVFAPTGVESNLGETSVPSMTGTFADGFLQFLGVISTVFSSLRGMAGSAVNSSGSVMVIALAIGCGFLIFLWFDALKLVSSRRR